jgi:hypothetical protein
LQPTHGRRADSRKVLREIGKEVDKSEWYMYPQEVNAYYASQSNEIVFPAGILTVRHPHLPTSSCLHHACAICEKVSATINLVNTPLFPLTMMNRACRTPCLAARTSTP